MSFIGYLVFSVFWLCMSLDSDSAPFQGCLASVFGYQHMRRIGLIKGMCSVFCCLFRVDSSVCFGCIYHLSQRVLV